MLFLYGLKAFLPLVNSGELTRNYGGQSQTVNVAVAWSSPLTFQSTWTPFILCF